LNTIDISIELYQENIGILGMQGTGKTHFARKLLDRYPKVPRLIISPQKPVQHFGEYGYQINKVSEIDNGKAMLWTGDFTLETFKQICNRISNEIEDMLFVVDDCHEFCTKQQIIPEWERIIQSKRNDGIFGLYMSPMPNRVNNTILQSLKHIFAFRMASYTQVEWMEREYFHQNAWILLEKDLRKKEPPQYSEIEFLAKGSYIYRGWTDTKVQYYFSEFQDMVNSDDGKNEIENQVTAIPENDEKPIVKTDELKIETTESKTNIAKVVKDEDEDGENL